MLSSIDTKAGDEGVTNTCATPSKARAVHQSSSSTNSSAGIYSTAFNLANIVLGVGALGMPSAFSDSGIISGLLMLALICFAGHYTALLLIKCANKVGVDSYEKLAEKILGTAGYLIFCILGVLANVGAAICYIMFISECCGMGNFGLIILCTFTILPLSFVKDWESLSILSKIKTFAYALVVLFILLRPWNDGYASHPKRMRELSEFIHDRQTWFSMNIFKSMGTFVFGTCYHVCLFAVRKGMNDQTAKAWGQTSSCALAIVYVISSVIGIGGFINFRPIARTLTSNVLTAEEEERLFSDDAWFKIARFTLVGLMLMTVPMCIHVSRDYVQAIITKVKDLCGGNKETEEMMVEHVFFEDGKQIIVKETAKSNAGKNIAIGFLNMFKMTLLEYLIATSLFALSLFGSIWLAKMGGVGKIMDAIGNYALGSFGFIFPPIIFLCTFKRNEYSTWTLIMVMLILAWGLFVWFYETSQHFKMNWAFEKQQCKIE